jgi:hypothetical protein
VRQLLEFVKLVQVLRFFPRLGSLLLLLSARMVSWTIAGVHEIRKCRSALLRVYYTRQDYKERDPVHHRKLFTYLLLRLCSVRLMTCFAGLRALLSATIGLLMPSAARAHAALASMALSTFYADLIGLEIFVTLKRSLLTFFIPQTQLGSLVLVLLRRVTRGCISTRLGS